MALLHRISTRIGIVPTTRLQIVARIHRKCQISKMSTQALSDKKVSRIDTLERCVSAFDAARKQERTEVAALLEAGHLSKDAGEVYLKHEQVKQKLDVNLARFLRGGPLSNNLLKRLRRVRPFRIDPLPADQQWKSVRSHQSNALMRQVAKSKLADPQFKESVCVVILQLCCVHLCLCAILLCVLIDSEL
jgi:hypothetical protein